MQRFSFFQAEDGIRDLTVTGVQTCALPISVAEDGSELLGLVSEPTISEQGADAVMARIVKLARASMAAARAKEIAGVGIGSPGPLDTKTGVVLLTPNLGWTNFPLRDRLARAPGPPPPPPNNAHCAPFCERWRGAAPRA